MLDREKLYATLAFAEFEKELNYITVSVIVGHLL